MQNNPEDPCTCSHPFSRHSLIYNTIINGKRGVNLICMAEYEVTHNASDMNIPCDCLEFKIDNLAYVASFSKGEG